MVLMLIKIQRWLLKSKVWSFVCFFSCVVGLLCYGFSSSFNRLLGKWTLWKILLYIVFSFIICLAVLFAKTWERSISSRVEAHMAFFVLMITTVYSFFIDKEAKGKPDAYSVASSAAFAIMSLGLARLSHLGFELDLLYFFCGVLTVQLMKIKLLLVIVGGSLSYSLIILRSTLDDLTRSEYHEFQDQDHVVIEFGLHSQSQETRTRTSPSATQVDSSQAIIITAQEADSPRENEDPGFLVTQSQEVNSDSDNSSILAAQFMVYMEVLTRENGNVIDTIFKHVDEYLKANIFHKDQLLVTQLYRDDNLVVDSLPVEILNDLRESARLMVAAGLKQECLHMYSTCRKEFLNEILSTFATEGLNMEDIDKVVKTQYSIKALCVVDRILLPNERRLFELVFERSILLEEHPALPGIDRLVGVLKREDIYPATSHRIDGFRLWKSLDIYPALATTGIEVFRFDRSLAILRDLLNLAYGVKEQAIVPDGRLHRITLDVLKYSEMMYHDWVGLFGTKMIHKEGRFSLSGHMAMITDLLDSSLEAISKNYSNPVLGYLFIINNRSFIELKQKRSRFNSFKHIFGDDWLQKNRTKFQQNLELYQRSSWNKILNLLKLDINELEPNVAARLMKNKLRSFSELFDDICNVQSTWFVLNDELREQLIKSIENILLPAYGNFIRRVQDFLGNHAYEHIKYGIFNVQDRLNNNLFLVRE